jgi:hypothetical protein
VPARPRQVELSVERPLGGAPGAGVVRLTARFDGAADVPPRELAEALERLQADLEALVGPPLAAAASPREERPLAELIETYHPRQRELVDLLRDEGELTAVEHGLLVGYLDHPAAPAPRPPPAAAAPPPPSPAPPADLLDQPIAAAPIQAERATDSARPVAELLRTFQIESLRQAGAVRARRQISFDEYMALKRHFESAGAPGKDRGAAAGARP